MHAPAYNRAVAEEKKHSRILALDVGNRRIGLAVSDELGITAQGLRTLERTSKRRDLETLRKIARKYAVGEVVIGKPVHMSGDASRQSEKLEKFARELEQALELPIHFYDERLTSWEAHEMLDREGLSREEKKGKVDQIASTLILQGYLESKTQHRGTETQSDPEKRK
jgi:putative holliday junction resolvase